MDLIALYNTLQKLITPESHTSLEHTSAQRIWPSSFTPGAAFSGNNPTKHHPKHSNSIAADDEQKKENVKKENDVRLYLKIHFC